MTEIERAIASVFWMAVPIFVFIVDLIALRFVRLYVKAARVAGKGETLIGALHIFVILTIVAQSTNIVLALITLIAQGMERGALIVPFLVLFLGGQIFRGIAITWFVLVFIKLHREG
jgi:hypothetical protein